MAIQIQAAHRLLAAFNPETTAKALFKFGKKDSNGTILACLKWFAGTSAKKHKGEVLSPEEYMELFRAAARKIPNSAVFLKHYDANKPNAVEAASIGAALMYDWPAVKKAYIKLIAPGAPVDLETALQAELAQIQKKRAALLKKWGYKPDYDGAFSDDELNKLDPLHMKEVNIRKKLRSK